MEPLSAATRTASLQRMAQDPFDVLVIGGGITGAGVALDAAARGYGVALVDKADFASGTSSKATKLVHGGIRYLPEFDFGLVFEALTERGNLVKNAPHLVRPLTFVLPLYADARRPVGVPITPPRGYGLGLMLGAGLWVYDLMAGRNNVSRHRRIGAARALELVPRLRSAGLKEAFLYSDAQTDDARLTLAVLRTALHHGAVIANYAEVVGFAQQEDGRLTGARVRDALSGETLTVAARHLVNAAGIFAEQVESLAPGRGQVAIEPSRGVHLVVACERVGLGETAVVVPETEDGRILFIIPWEGRAVIGTTDTGSGELDRPQATPDEIAYLLRHVNGLLDVDLTERDVLSVFAGYRPLVREKGKSTSRLSRKHVVLRDPNGLVTVVGGKLTTYRRMAQDTVDLLARQDAMPRAHPTRRMLLEGAIDWPRARQELAARGGALGLGPDEIEHLGFFYGRDALGLLDLIEREPGLRDRLVPDLPYLRAEVVHACRFEMAVRLDDVVARRTRLILEARDRGLAAAGEVARLMARELGWPDERARAEREGYAASVREHLAAEGLLIPAAPEASDPEPGVAPSPAG